MSRRALVSVQSSLGWIAAWSAVLTAILLWPLHKSGYLLTRDAVTTPRTFLTPSSMGLGESLARAVPQDGFIVFFSQFIDGGVLVKIMLFLALTLAGVGAAAVGWYFLFPGTRAQALAQGLPAATFAIWNPYVVERLLQGHWSLLVGYATLPWIALVGTLTFSPGTLTRRTSWAGLAATMAVAALTPTGAILGMIMAVVGVLVPKRTIDATEVRIAHDHSTTPLRSWQRILIVLFFGLLVCSPWLYPSLLHYFQGNYMFSDTLGVSAFAARGEGPNGAIGVFFPLLGLGGIWNSEVVPPSHASFYVIFSLAITFALLGIGLWRFRRSRARKTIYIWMVLGLLLVFTISFFSYPIGINISSWMMQKIPGAGLFRDTQKWVALLFPLYSVLISAAGRAFYEFAARRNASSNAIFSTSHSMSYSATTSTSDSESDTNESDTSSVTPRPQAMRPALRPTARPSARSTVRPTLGPTVGPSAAIALLCLLLIMVVPDAPLVTHRQLEPVHYSSTWNEVINATKGSNGDIAVMPSGQLRVLPEAPNRPVLDPAARMLPVEVINTGDLAVRIPNASQGSLRLPQQQSATLIVNGENDRARLVEAALLEGAPAGVLGSLGIRWVLIENVTAPSLPDTLAFRNSLRHLEPVVTAPDLSLYRVTGTVSGDYWLTRWQWALAFTTHIVWGLMMIGGYVAMIWLSIKDRKRSAAASQER